jgi:hypothetical protein
VNHRNRLVGRQSSGFSRRNWDSPRRIHAAVYFVFSRRTDNKALNSMQRWNICANRARTKYSCAQNFWAMKISTQRVNAALISNAFTSARR